MRTWIRGAFIAGLGAAVLGIGLPADSVLQAQSARCDRQCLADIMTQYLNAVVAHDTKTLPLSDKVRFTEDTVEMKPGAMQFTVMPREATSRANDFDMPMVPALDAA